jgi:hypothetical protein
MSAIDPGPIVNGATLQQPARKRKPISISKFVATAHAMVKTMYPALQMWYTHIRPYSSLKGAMKSGPKAVEHVISKYGKVGPVSHIPHPKM